MRLALLICLLFSSTGLVQAQLIINEISQGTGSQEYVEFVVMGTPTCQTPVPTVDLRGVVIDDNNGDFAPGAGTGIATGAIRFSNTAFWSAVPQGTIIVIYSDSDPNSVLPANDNSLSDGNCTLVLPANSNLLEGQGTSPSSPGNSNYPPNASWTAGGGTWTQIAMSNSNDSFQIRSSILSASSDYSVSWGNNTTGTQIYFPTATGAVFSFENTIDNNETDQANWVQGAVGQDETPGQPNNPSNAAWIAGMNPTCYNINPLTIVLTPTNSGCGSNCTGSVSSIVSGGNAPYIYSWNTGASTADITNQCSGNYTLTVTDAGGCSDVQTTVIGQNSTLSAQALVSNESCDGECDGSAAASAIGGTAPYGYSWSNSFNGQNNQNLCPGWYILTVTDQNSCTSTINVTIQPGNTVPSSAISDPGTHLITGGLILLPSNGMGTWTSDCGSCIGANGVFDPNISGIGTFEVCYTTTSGNCSSTTCDEITITQGCVDVESTSFFLLCQSDTIVVNGIEYTTIGTYDQNFVLPSGCDSISHIFIAACFDANYTIEIPNVITPNGDQVNDQWEVPYTGLFLETGFISNRWGNVIENINGPEITWNGSSNGNECLNGVYFYELQFTNGLGESVVKHGFIHLYR